MFTGIDGVDWASMRHAYGNAEDVPGLLRGLASTDPAEREIALDGMYGAVHHQGDVYDSTLACVPFLFALAGCEDVRDRDGIVELLVSIGGGENGESEGDGDGSDEEGAGEEGYHREARAAVRAGAEVFVALTADPDAGVRRAAPEAVVRFLDAPRRVLELLRERLTVERDDRVLTALIGSLGLFAERHPGHAGEAVDLLAAQSSPPYGPGLRLAALGQLAGCAPDRLPADLVGTVVELLRDRSRQRPCRPDEPGHPDMNTLIGHLRRLRPSDEEGSQLLRTLHSALGDRVSDRIALLNGQLTSPDPTDRCNAVWMSAGLLREWRADYTESVALLGAQLGAEEDRLREAAVSVLADLFELAVPAADDLHALLESRPDLWVRRWKHGAPTLGDPLKALARCGDPRAAPVLARVLAGAVVPDDLGQVIPHLGLAAAPLAPALRHRLGGVPLDAPDTYDRASSLLSALAALRDGDALPEVLRLLRGVPEGARLRDTVVEAAVHALGAFGPAAGEAVPVLRGLLDTEHAIGAAGALWSVEGEASESAVLPVLRRELVGENGYRRRRAAEALEHLGPSARPALPALRRMVDTGTLWERMSAACAVSRITGDPGPVLPVLRSIWTENPHTRTTIADCLTGMGPAAAPARDLFETELASARRHLAQSEGYGSHEVHSDERLLRACRDGLAGGGGGGV
ncbi:HEAT repeat domain-containing protein [Streptomyces sp. NPDC048751]|uniref:HEAT repeat domain-containing protein n=1 Tax=Streptomyces sp. NPDC048751 TaxID=3365591 RepID=UPI00371CE254